MRRVEARVRWLTGLPSATGLRIARYTMFGHAILRYWLTLLPPAVELRKAERRWGTQLTPPRRSPSSGWARKRLRAPSSGRCLVSVSIRHCSRQRPGDTAVVIRWWLRSQDPEASLLEGMVRAGIPAGEATATQVAELIGVLRKKVLRD